MPGRARTISRSFHRPGLFFSTLNQKGHDYDTTHNTTILAPLVATGAHRQVETNRLRWPHGYAGSERLHWAGVEAMVPGNDRAARSLAVNDLVIGLLAGWSCGFAACWAYFKGQRLTARFRPAARGCSTWNNPATTGLAQESPGCVKRRLGWQWTDGRGREGWALPIKAAEVIKQPRCAVKAPGRRA